MAEITKNVEEAVEAKEAKMPTKTDLLKKNMQAIVKQSLGVKVSKEKAWDLFKAMIHGTVELTVNVEGKSIPLSGVGTFEVLETKPRGSKAGLDKDGNPIEGAKVWDCVPRFRFYPSSAIDKMLEQIYGLADHGIEMKHYGIFAGEAVEETAEEEVATAEVAATTEAPAEVDEI
jgi:nucleoid DNA-binding protein